MNRGLTKSPSFAARSTAANRAGLSCSRKPLRNQWITDPVILIKDPDSRHYEAMIVVAVKMLIEHWRVKGIECKRQMKMKLPATISSPGLSVSEGQQTSVTKEEVVFSLMQHSQTLLHSQRGKVLP